MVAHVAVGQRTKRLDAPQKLTGQERFTADLQLPGLLHARLVGSAYAHARILGVDASAALVIPGVVAVLTAQDLPFVKDELGNPSETPLAIDEALYAGHPVAVVLAESAAAAEDGANSVVVDAEPMEVIATIDRAMDPAAPRVRLSGGAANEDEAAMHNADAAQKAEGEQETLPPNVSNTIHFERGDIAAGFAEAAKVVELAFTSEMVHQGYLEPQVALASIEPLGDITVYTSTQAAFYCRSRVATTLGLPVHRVKVVPMPVGGGFGGKFVLIEPLVAALAVSTKRPVLLAYNRIDDFLTANPAPGCQISVKLGATADGTITALQSRMVFAAGSTSGSPLQIAAILLGGYYKFPNLDIRGYEAMTHRPKSGAYRAPGAQQASLAIESAIDELALALEIDPLDFRIKNCAEEGDLRPNGGAWPKIGLKPTLEAVRDHPRWQNRAQSRAAGRGVGIAVGGWPGGIEPASATCRLDSDGKLTVVLGSVDLNGTNTVFAQIAAEAFGMAPEDIRITTADTDSAPFAGGTGGSKITYTVGPAVQKAAADAREQLLNIAAQHLEASSEDLEMADGMIRVKGVPTSGVSLQQIAQMSMSFGGKFEPVLGKGGTAINESSPGFAVHLAEVSVDEMTGETTVHAYVAAQDVGFAINPALVEGQIHGGVVQGLGWALWEGMTYDGDGQLLSASFMDYIMPRAEMVPEIETILVEVASDHGPYGAKGVGEPPAIPGPATIANALRDATGVRLGDIPFRPEVVSAGLRNGNRAQA